MKKKNKVSLLLSLLSGVVWRIGGKGGFKRAKLFRRLGTPIFCILLISLFTPFVWWKYLIAYIMLTWGACSYFGWINKLLSKNCRKCLLGKGDQVIKFDCMFFVNNNEKSYDCSVDNEYWWNFLAEAFVMQASIFLFKQDFEGFLFVFCFSVVGAIGKVLIDKSKIKHQDTYSEFYFGFIMALGIFLNFL